jgi:hypothetical protein
MEPQSSLPYSQAPVTCPYPEPTPSSPHNPFPLNPLNAELNPIRHLLALVGAHHFVHVSRIRVKQTNNLQSYK